MHFYKIPGPADAAEISKLRDLTDQFNQSSIQAFQKNPQKMMAVGNSLTMEEAGTMQGIMALVKSPDGKASTFEIQLTLQFTDIMAGVLQRVDAPLTASAVPAAMATAEVADLFKKNDLPELEKLVRSAIKPATP